jgi:hypothetical protein
MLHLAVASTGTWLLTRRLGSSPAGATVAGLAFSCSTFSLAWLSLPSVLSTVSWIPWLLAGIVTLLRNSGDGFRYGQMILVATATSMMVLAGHLQFVAYGGMAVIAVLATLAVVGFRKKEAGLGRGLMGAGLGLVLGGCLAAPQLLPVLSFSQFSHRRNNPTAEGYAAYNASAIPVRDLFARLMDPMTQGDPKSVYDVENRISGYWPAIERPGANFAESAVTLGPVVLGLVVLALARKRLTASNATMVVLAVLSLAMALGTPLNQLLYFGVPGWSSTGSPGRVLVIFILACSVLAGLAFREERDDSSATRAPWIAMGVLGLCFVAAFVMSGQAQPASGLSPEQWSQMVASAQLAALPSSVGLLLCGLALVFAAHRFPEKASWVAVGLAAALALVQSQQILRSGNSSFLAKQPGENSNRSAWLNENWSLVAAVPALLPPNLATSLRQHDLGGYDSLLHRDTVALLTEINGQDSAPPANGNMMFIKPTVNPEKIAEAGVTEIWSRQEVSSLGPASSHENGVFRYMVAGSGRIAGTLLRAEIVEERMDRIVIRAIGPGTLLLRDRMMPGWTAEIDGSPVTIAGERWRNVEVPDGTHTVTMIYRPPGLDLGQKLGGVGGLGVAALFSAAVFTQTRRRKGSEPESPIVE